MRIHRKPGLFLLFLPLGLPGANCEGTSTGLQPLTEPFFTSRQPFVQGGLYPNSSNLRPASHEASGLAQAAQVRPRNAAGEIDESSGRIVFISIGMSNTTQEFSVFRRLAQSDPERNPRLEIVDGAQGGWPADRLVTDGAAYWATVEQRLRAAGVTPMQVQTAWMKQADARPALAFPEDARKLQEELKTIARELRRRFPNLRLLYLSSRTYAGYASTDLNPEPFAYQSGFAVKWLIEEQINGAAELGFSTGAAPWIAWGPYLWADGVTARQDGLNWLCRDFEQDGTHPAAAGESKVARLLLNFLHADSTARLWYRRLPADQPQTPKIDAIVNAATQAPALTAGSIATLYGTNLAAASMTAQGLPLPEAIAGTSVTVGGFRAYLYSVSPTQINFVVPNAPPSNQVVVRRETVESNSIAINLDLYAPGIFTLDSSPAGPAAALHADGRVVGSADPARPGETLMLFVTGMGVRNPMSLRPDFLPVIRLGGADANVVFSGPAPGFPGLHQINFEVPASVPFGLSIPLVLQMASASSNTATLAAARE